MEEKSKESLQNSLASGTSESYEEPKANHAEGNAQDVRFSRAEHQPGPSPFQAPLYQHPQLIHHSEGPLAFDRSTSAYLSHRNQQSAMQAMLAHNPANNVVNVESSDAPIEKRPRQTKSAKRQRTTFTSQQILQMEASFQSNKYLMRTQRAEMAHNLGLKERQIKVWFQNRRMKCKKDDNCSNQSQNGNSSWQARHRYSSAAMQYNVKPDSATPASGPSNARQFESNFYPERVNERPVYAHQGEQYNPAASYAYGHQHYIPPASENLIRNYYGHQPTVVNQMTRQVIVSNRDYGHNYGPPAHVSQYVQQEVSPVFQRSDRENEKPLTAHTGGGTVVKTEDPRFYNDFGAMGSGEAAAGPPTDMRATSVPISATETSKSETWSKAPEDSEETVLQSL